MPGKFLNPSLPKSGNESSLGMTRWAKREPMRAGWHNSSREKLISFQFLDRNYLHEGRSEMNQPRRWSAEELYKDSRHATLNFRMEHLIEPLEEYLEAFDECLGDVEVLFETTIDLTELDETAIQFLTDQKSFGVFRYLLGPPISEDDLETVAEVQSLNPRQLGNDPEAVQRILAVVRMGMDRRRFPWVQEEREPTETERKAAILASAALMATERVGTDRRSKGKKAQEGIVSGMLTGAGLVEVAKRKVLTLTEARDWGNSARKVTWGNAKPIFLSAFGIIALWRLSASFPTPSNASTTPPPPRPRRG